MDEELLSESKIWLSNQCQTQQWQGNSECRMLWINGEKSLQKSTPPSSSGHDGPVDSTAFLVDGRLVTGSTDYKIKIWDPNTGVCTQTLVGHGQTVQGLVCLDHGRLASVSADECRIWDIFRGICISSFRIDPIGKLAFSKYGRFLAVMSATEVKVWNTATGDQIQTLEHRFLNSIAFSTDTFLATATDDSGIKIWDVEQGTTLLTVDDSAGIMAFSSDAQLAVTSWNDSIRIWSTSTGTASCLTLQGHVDAIRMLCFIANDCLASASIDDGNIMIWDTNTGVCVSRLECGSTGIRSMTSSIDGRQLVSASRDGTVHVWDVVQKSCVRHLQGSRPQTKHVVFSPCKDIIASVFNTHSPESYVIKIHDLSQPNCQSQCLSGHSNVVKSVAFSPNGKFLLSGSRDCTIRMWDTATWACVHILTDHSGVVLCVCFSHNGQYLASTATDGTLRIWNASIGQCIMTRRGMDCAAFSKDDQIVASAINCDIDIWDLTERHAPPLHKLKAKGSDVFSMAFSTDGLDLVSLSSEDETGMQIVQIWNVLEGACHTSLMTDEMITRVSFDGLGTSRLSTNLGTLTVKEMTASQGTQRVVQHCGYHLDRERKWIQKDGENILRLPPQCQALCWEINGQMIALVLEAGAVLVLNLSKDPFAD